MTTKALDNQPNPKREHTFTMAEYQAQLIFKQIEGHTHALKNWIAGAVERGKFDYAQELTQELREHEALFACFNVGGYLSVAQSTGRDVVTQHEPRYVKGRSNG